MRFVGKMFRMILGGVLFSCPLCTGEAWTQPIPKDAQQSFYKAQKAIDDKNYRQAIKILDDYLKKKTAAEHPLAYEILGNAWYKEGNLEKADRAFQEGFELNQKSFELCSNLATIAYESNHFEKAGGLFEKAYQLSKKSDGELLYRAAVSYSKGGEPIEARRLLQELAVGRKEMPQEWWQFLIQVEIELADWNDAERYLATYIQHFNTQAADWKLLGRVYMKQKKYVAAAAAIEIEYSLEEPSSSDWKELADLYFYLGIPLQAVRCLEKAYGPNPAAGRCEEIAEGYARAHQLQRAIHYAQQAVKVEPSGPRYTELGRLYYQSGNWQKATDALNTALQFEGIHGLVHLLLGYSAIELGNPDSARLAFEKAAQDDAYRTRAQQAMRALEAY